MTQAQFITSIEAKPNFIKWASAPEMKEKIGDIEKWNGIAFISTPDGKNTFNVWFVVDTATGEASWQNSDSLEPEANTDQVKILALRTYLKANYRAFFLEKVDLETNAAIVDVVTKDVTPLRQTILVIKEGTKINTYIL